jgi:hypothetical protein
MAKGDKKEAEKIKNEKGEVWMRIPVGLLSGIIIYIWAYLIAVFFIMNLIYKIFTGKKLDELSEMSETWNTQCYYFTRYMTFCSDERPFPFEILKEKINQIED